MDIRADREAQLSATAAAPTDSAAEPHQRERLSAHAAVRRRLVVATSVAAGAGSAGSFRRHAAVAVVLALACLGATPAEIPGVVIKVTSGDRLVLDTGNERFNVTLSEITAPPAQTPLGTRARASLASLCYGQAATLAITGTAEDGSTIGQVSCAGRDAAEEQVRGGLAKLKEPFPKLDSLLGAAEQNARTSRLGLWAGD
jgi:endonuclease YncB( thermonuclease family)